MIESIEINNFKSIKQKFFPLRNLNILLGLNGMGKSSFIQNLLALRQSRDIARGRLDLNGDYVKIGTVKDALYQYAQNTPFYNYLKFSNNFEQGYTFSYKIGSDFFEALHYNGNIHSLEIKAKLYRESLFNEKNFQYLNANRLEPKTIHYKSYSHTVESRNIGNMGEYTAHFIEMFSSDPVQLQTLIHPRSKIKDEITNEYISNNILINQINLWMGEISPNVNIRTTSISSDNVMLEYVYKQPNLGETNRFKPENVGFGITYGLPVVVALLKAKPGDLVIIENPESHIHPKGQAELGKMIALAAMGGVQLVIETHSDHLVNGIRVAIKEKLLDKDKAIVFYFEKEVKSNEQYSKITNIEIDQNGEFSEYPTDMMDEWNNQLMKLL